MPFPASEQRSRNTRRPDAFSEPRRGPGGSDEDQKAKELEATESHGGPLGETEYIAHNAVSATRPARDARGRRGSVRPLELRPAGAMGCPPIAADSSSYGVTSWRAKRPLSRSAVVGLFATAGARRIPRSRLAQSTRARRVQAGMRVSRPAPRAVDAVLSWRMGKARTPFLRASLVVGVVAVIPV